MKHEVVNFYKDGDTYPDWPANLDVKPDELSWWMNVVGSIKALGNEHYKVDLFLSATKKSPLNRRSHQITLRILSLVCKVHLKIRKVYSYRRRERAPKNK